MKTIVIDPGHGGSDPGAVNGDRLEKNDNLRLGLAVRDILKNHGINVIMTRTTDVYVPLARRREIADRNLADIFISLHRNSFANPEVNGVENIIHPYAQDMSRTYAKKVLDKVVAVGVNNNRGIKEYNLAVLRNAATPSMLLELGFISNDSDNALFDKKFNEYAKAIAQGLTQSLGISDNKGETAPAAPPAYTPPDSPPPSSAGTDMASIAKTLNERYGFRLRGDEGFNDIKSSFVKALQIELNQLFGASLRADGVFGPLTKAVVPLLEIGSSGDLVYLLQAALTSAGFPVVPDGIFGPKTQQAVKDFQAANNLKVDGIAGPATFERLLK